LQSDREKLGYYLIVLKKNQKHIYKQVIELTGQNKAFIPEDE
jgi:hypothetical protein